VKNQTTPWQGVYFFTNPVFTKIIEHNDVIKNMTNIIGKKNTYFGPGERKYTIRL